MLYKKVMSLILSASLSTAASAVKELPADLHTGWDMISQTSLRSDLKYLTADERQGRLALTQGNADTINWLVEQFKKAGLKPGNGDSYLQSFNIIEYHPDAKNTFVEMQRGGKKVILKKPDVFTDFQRDVTLTSDVVFAGYGITAPELQYDDYQNIDVKGKLVLVFEHEPQETDAKSIFNGTGNTPYATARVKALNAQKHGAVGLLIIPEPNRKHPSNQERRARIGGASKRKQPIPEMALENDELQIPIAVLSDKASKAIAGKLPLSELQKQIDADLKPRSQIIPDTTITLQEKLQSRRVAETSNVVALLEGTDSSLKKETIIISAHHDHDGMDGKQVWHGADDNASGTAGVIAAARAMNSNSEHGLQPKRSVLFAVFAAEERGLLGSYYMAANPLRPLATTRAMINFDMIGRDEKRSQQTDGLITVPPQTNNRLNLIGSHFSPDYAKVVSEQNEYVGLILDDRFNYENALNTFFRSDQFPFILHNVPAFWWFTGFHPDYHHVTDTADKIDYVKMQKIIRLAYLSAYQFANTATPPAFVADPRP